MLGFLNDGICPQEKKEFQALAIFLVKNKLPSALTWLLVQTGAETLELDNCELGQEALRVIAGWAKSLPFQFRLDLSGNCIDAAGAALLADALGANTITHLDLGNNALQDQGVQALCAGLGQNTSLRSLVLHHCSMTNPGVQALADVVDAHAPLTALVLDGNAFDEHGAAIFAAALGRSRTLSSLSLRVSRLSDAGMACIARALISNTGLRSLALSGQDEECEHLPNALADALAANQTLATLVVYAGPMADPAARRRAAGMALNSTLRDFELWVNPYGRTKENEAVMRQISDKVQANALIAQAGLALSELSQMPESGVPVPAEIGDRIAAFTAQVAGDERRSKALKSIGEAGPLRAARPDTASESKNRA
ncbi:MAG: hypothetical protein ABWY05_02045 [Noviherbaspirillum sp.]